MSERSSRIKVMAFNAQNLETQVQISKSDPCACVSTSCPRTTSITSTVQNVGVSLLEDEFTGRRDQLLRVRSVPSLLSLMEESNEDSMLNFAKFKILFPCTQGKEMCYVDLRGSKLSKIDKNVLLSWEDVIGIDAGENEFQMETFRFCRALEELSLPLNYISRISISINDFVKLKNLDLSCNSLIPSAIYSLGQLPNLKILDLSYNNITFLPNGINFNSYKQLEVLILDYNSISHPNSLVILSRLRKLKTLSMKYNKVWSLPFIDTKTTYPFYSKRMEKFGLGDVVKKLITIDDQIIRDLLLLRTKEKRKLSTITYLAKKKDVAVYLRDERNDGMPFPCLKQLDLKKNMIFQVGHILAVKTWKNLNELVLVENPVLGQPSQAVKDIWDYLVPNLRIEQTQFSCRLSDPKTDPFLRVELINKFVKIKQKIHCSCHNFAEGKYKDIEEFNLDVSTPTPEGISSLPLPNKRLCAFLRESSPPEIKQSDKMNRQWLKKLILNDGEVNEICENIVNNVPPSTLPSTIKATKIALHGVVKNMNIDQLTNLVKAEENLLRKEENEFVLFSGLFRRLLLKKLYCKLPANFKLKVKE